MNMQALYLLLCLFLGTLIIELFYETVLSNVKDNCNRIAIIKAVKIFLLVMLYYFILFAITRSLVYIDISHLMKSLMG